MTRVLTGFVWVFLSRNKAKIRWIPLAWALGIFILQVQFWWAIIELEALLHVWTRGMFASLLLLPLSLFAAAALVLPQAQLAHNADLGEAFEQDGKWALLAVSLYCIVALVANVRYFSAPLWSLNGALVAGEAALPLAYLAFRSARWRVVVTVLQLSLVTVASWLLSPVSY